MKNKELADVCEKSDECISYLADWILSNPVERSQMIEMLSNWEKDESRLDSHRFMARFAIVGMGTVSQEIAKRAGLT